MARGTSLLLMRHGESEANARGILAGRDNTIGLTERGRGQVHDAAIALSKVRIDRIIISPLKRCRESAAPVKTEQRKSRGVSPSSSIERGIIEMDYGSWSGKKLSILSKKKEWAAIQQSPSRFTFPEGESFEEMRARAIAAVEKQVAVGGCVLLVSHGDLIKMIITHYMGASTDSFQKLAIDPASISRIDFHGSSVRIVTVNQTSHLTDKARQGSTTRNRRLDLGGGNR